MFYYNIEFLRRQKIWHTCHSWGGHAPRNGIFSVFGTRFHHEEPIFSCTYINKKCAGHQDTSYALIRNQLFCCQKVKALPFNFGRFLSSADLLSTFVNYYLGGWLFTRRTHFEANTLTTPQHVQSVKRNPPNAPP
jgi:hypothetical protein